MAESRWKKVAVGLVESELVVSQDTKNSAGHYAMECGTHYT